MQQAALPEKIAYLDDLTKYFIRKTDTRKMKKLMFIYKKCKEKKEEQNYTFRGIAEPAFIKIPAQQMVHIGKYLTSLDWRKSTFSK